MASVILNAIPKVPRYFGELHPSALFHAALSGRNLYNRLNYMESQRAQYPLIKEYSLNHNMNPLINPKPTPPGCAGPRRDLHG